MSPRKKIIGASIATAFMAAVTVASGWQTVMSTNAEATKTYGNISAGAAALMNITGFYAFIVWARNPRRRNRNAVPS